MPSLREQIESLYVGYYNRAADPGGLNYWLERASSGSMSLPAIAQSFSVQPETVALYGSLSSTGVGSSSTAQETFIRSVYANLFGRTEVDAAGLNYWKNQLSSGAPAGNIIQDIISGAQGNDATVISNKVAVSDYFITQLVSKSAEFLIGAARAALTNVTSSTSAVTAARTSVDGTLTALSHPINGTAGEDTLNGTPNPDVINGLGGNDEIFGGLGADVLNGGGGNDLFIYTGGPDAAAQPAGDTLNGGDGMDFLGVYFSTDFRGLTNPTLTDASIERVAIKTKGGGDGVNVDTDAIFNGSQLHDQAIFINTYNDPAVADGTKLARLIIFASNGNDFSKLRITDYDTADPDAGAFDAANNAQIIIRAGDDATKDTITGTPGDDRFLVTNGGDTYNGGAGNDSFIFEAGDSATGMTINGGAGFDSLIATVPTDFSGLNGGAALSANSIEAILIQTKGASAVTATFDGAQLTGQAVAINTYTNPGDSSANAATLRINVTSGNGNFGGIIFSTLAPGLTTGFASSTDKINIFGAAGNDTITGTSINDTITGGGGADILTGRSGSDVFAFDGTAGANVSGLTTGDTVTDFATGADKLQFTNVVEVASGQQAAVQSAVTALTAGASAAAIATAMATANTTNLGVASAVFEGSTYVYFERTGSGSGVAADDVFIKLAGVASGFSFAGDVAA